jgi:hypothetical protein
MGNAEAPRRGKLRRLVYSALLGLLVLGVLELAASAALRLLFAGLDVQAFAAQRLEAATAADRHERRAGVLGDDALHPYVGYLKREAFQDLFAAVTGPKSDGELWVLVVGGLVADVLNRWGQLEAAFERELEAAGSDRTLRLFNGANGGYKQPQQLLLVGYLLALGAPIDLVINLDGFNEVVLPYADNARLGVNPFYPRAWSKRLAMRSGELDPVVVGKIAALRERQRRILGWVADNSLGALATVRLAAALIYSDAEGRIVALQERLSVPAGELSLEQRGGESREFVPDQVLIESARLWARASLLLADVLQPRGIEYFHFLQPNQYLEGSKPLSAEERVHFYRPEGRYGRYARAGYPRLLQAAADQGLESIHYFDATALFLEATETLYEDPCCHLNQRGNRILAEFIARRVLERSQLFAP